MSETKPEVRSAVIEGLVTLADQFCAATGRSRAWVSKATLGRGSQIEDLAAGRRDIVTGTAEDMVQWFSDNWPADADWPDHLPRPAGTPPASDARPGAAPLGATGRAQFPEAAR